MPNLLSVIMPVYNQEDFLAETIESVLNQTYKEFDFLIVDDGSTDRTAEIIKKYAVNDNRIKAFFNKNEGRANATNFLVQKSASNFCALIDADDVMLPNRLEEQLYFHTKNTNIDASSVHSYYIDKKGRLMGIQHYPFLKDLEDYNTIRQNKTIVHCAITGLMIKRESYLEAGGLDKRFWPCDDFEFINKLIDGNFKILILNKILMKYRFHQNSATSKKQWHMFDKMGYVGYNLELRRNGNVEIEFDEYIKQYNKNADFFKKLKLLMHRQAMILHRKAGFNFYKKNLFKFSNQIMIAFILDYKYVNASLKNRIKFFKK